ncbi:MAG: hypothetical protein ACPL7L_05970, partial [bacterium]
DDRNYLLGGTLSTRVYLKQEHAFLSHTLEGHLEPLFSVLSCLGRPYPEDFLRYLWKSLLLNSPHDSICGCSIDEVHEEMMIRYRKMRDVTGKLLQPSFAFQNLTSTSYGDTLVIFNPHPYPFSGYLEGDLYLQRKKIREVDFEVSKIREFPPEAEDFLPGIALISSGETVVPEILAQEEVALFETPAHTLPEVFQAKRYRVGFVVCNLPPLGFRLYRVEVSHRRETVKPPEVFLLENEFYRVEVGPQGTLTIMEKETQMVFPIGPVFEDGSDAGDEYDYSPCLEDMVVTTESLVPEISWVRYTPSVQRIRIAYAMNLPRGLTEDRKRRQSERIPCPLILEVQLTSGMKRLDFRVYFENRVLEHRLQVV